MSPSGYYVERRSDNGRGFTWDWYPTKAAARSGAAETGGTVYEAKQYENMPRNQHKTKNHQGEKNASRNKTELS